MKKLPAIDMKAAEVAAGAEVEEAAQYLDHIRNMEITTHPEMKFAVGVTAEIKERHAAVDAQRRKFTDPAQVVIDEANAFFNPALNSLAECEKVLKAEIVAYDLRMSARRDDLLETAGLAAACGNKSEAEQHLENADACIVPKVAGLSMRRSVEVKVTDEAAALAWCVENNRFELLQLNEKAIKALAKASNGRGPDVPGVSVTRTSGAAITVAKVERG